MADWITTARPMRIETLRNAALDGQDWEIVALAILAEPAATALPAAAFDVLQRVGIRAMPASPLDIVKLTSIANFLERMVR